MPKNVTSPSLRRNVHTGRPCPYSIQHYGAQEVAAAPHSAQQRAHGAYEYRLRFFNCNNLFNYMFGLFEAMCHLFNRKML